MQKIVASEVILLHNFSDKLKRVHMVIKDFLSPFLFVNVAILILIQKIENTVYLHKVERKAFFLEDFPKFGFADLAERSLPRCSQQFVIS